MLVAVCITDINNNKNYANLDVTGSVDETHFSVEAAQHETRGLH